MTIDLTPQYDELTNPTGPRIPFGDPRYCAVMDFLIQEARLLDENRLQEWLECFDDDLSYTAPVRRTTLRRDGPGIDFAMGHFDDDLASIRMRVRRLTETQSAYAEDPPSRTRRLITNVSVYEAISPDEYQVISSLLLLRNRASSPEYDLISGVRYEQIRQVDSALKISRRCVVLDQACLGTSNLGVFL